VACRDHRQDLALTLCQFRKGLGCVSPAEVFHNSAGHGCAKHAAALGHCLHRAYDLRLVGTLQEVAAGAHAKCGKHGIVVGEHGEHKNHDIWAAVGDATGGLDAAHAGHIEVHDYYVRLQLEAECDRLPPIGRLTDDIKARGIQRCRETVAEKGVIIGDQYA
jgi:hypothetical protein